MAYPKSLTAYNDIRPVFEAAQQNAGARYTLSSIPEAIRWRGRANYYRTLLRKEGVTTFDDLVFALDAETIIITLRAPLGTLSTLDGKALEAKAEDPLLAEALALRLNL